MALLLEFVSYEKVTSKVYSQVFFDWQMEVELCLFFLLSFFMSNAV